MNDSNTPATKPSRVSNRGMVLIAFVTLVSLGLCAIWVALLASDGLVAHAWSGTEYGMGAAYFATFATAAGSIALVFKLLVGKAEG